MSDIREALARVILVNSMCPGQEYLARHEADAILAEFLVVPRSDIVGTDYGVEADAHLPPEYHLDQAVAVDEARRRGVRVLKRPRLPWSVIPLPEAVTPCSDCGYPEGRQADCLTCKGVPIPEDGEPE